MLDCFGVPSGWSATLPQPESVRIAHKSGLRNIRSFGRADVDEDLPAHEYGDVSRAQSIFWGEPVSCRNLARGQILILLKPQMAHKRSTGQYVLLLNELQIQGDAHTVDEYDALVQKLLVRNLGIDELL
jgi:hypothetical protein